MSNIKKIIAGKEMISVENGIAYYNGYKEIIGVSKSTKIQSLVCKGGVEKISSSAFEGHKELVNVQLPQTIKSISDRAFANTGITEIIFPASLRDIGKEAFASCNLSAIIYDGQIADGVNAFDNVKFESSAYIKVQKIYKASFVNMYPKLKGFVKTPLPKWLSWLEWCIKKVDVLMEKEDAHSFLDVLFKKKIPIWNNFIVNTIGSNLAN